MIRTTLTALILLSATPSLAQDRCGNYANGCADLQRQQAESREHFDRQNREAQERYRENERAEQTRQINEKLDAIRRCQMSGQASC